APQPAAPGGARGVAGRIGRIARPGPQQPASASALARVRVGTVGRRLPALTNYEPAPHALYAGAALVLPAGLVAFVFYVPTARVTLVAQAQPFSTNVDIAADATPKSPVRVRVVTVTDRSDSVQRQATGTKVTPGQQAAGQFTYVNNCAF